MSSIVVARARRALAVVAISALTLLGLPALTAAPAAASSALGVTFSGTVTDALSAPLAGIEVRVQRAGSYSDVGSALTAADGTWSLPGSGGVSIAAGTFQVVALGGDRPDVWWPHSLTQDGAQIITLADGGAATGLDISLPDGHAISGHVTVQGGGSAEGVTVGAYLAGGLYSSRQVTVAADGSYKFQGLADGAWTVYFQGNAKANVVSAQLGDGTPVTVAGASVTGADKELIPGATISGTITAPGTPSYLSVDVYVHGADHSGVSATVVFGANGSYTASNLPAGSYDVRFSSPDLDYQWWNGAATQATATAVVLAQGGAQSGVDGTLSVAHSVSGTVTDAHGAPVASASVTAWDKVDSYHYAYTQADGSFTLAGLRAGTYVLSTYDGTDTHLPLSQDVVVGAANVTGVSLVMADAAVVVGHVLRIGGADVPSAEVSVQQKSGGTWYTTDSTIAGFTGTYRIGRLTPSTQYRLLVHDVTGEAVNATTAPFTSVAGLQTQDVIMSKGGRITGHVTGDASTALDAISVTVSGTDFYATVQTDASGAYVVGGLPSGSYTVDFGGTADYLPATVTVSVTAPNDTVADRALDRAAKITGTVVDGHGAPVAGVTVGADVVSSDITCGASFTAQTAADGTFTIGGLHPGNYHVEFGFPGCSGHTSTIVGEYWKDAPTATTATTVTLATGDTVSLVASVTRFSKISGTVDLGGHSPAGLSVSAYVVGGNYAAGTTTDATGAFSLALPAGDYKLRIDSETTSGFWYTSTPDRVLATVVHVVTETDQSGLAVVAPFTGAISGTVTVGGTAVGEFDDYVSVYDSRDRLVSSVWTDAAGLYVANALATGDYRLRVQGLGGSVWVGAPAGSQDFEHASVHHVTDGSTTTVNLALAAVGTGSGTITATVTAGSGPGAGYVAVVDSVTGDYVSQCYLSNSGVCTATVGPGSYKLQAVSQSTGYAATWYGGSSLATATIVTVSANVDTPVAFPLVVGGTIKATVRNDTAVSLDGTVTILSSSGEDVFDDYPSLGSGSQAVETSGALQPGAYRVTAAHDGEVTTSTVTVVAGSETATSLSFVSSAPSTGSTGTVKGTVTNGSSGVAGVLVCVGSYHTCSTSAADGSYTITNVRAGDDSVFLEGLPAGLVVVGSVPFATVDPQKSAVTTVAPITLAMGASVSGQVLRPTVGPAVPASDVNVYVFRGQEMVAQTTTRLDGSWTADSLPPGTYTVLADAGSDTLEPTWFGPSVSTQAAATPVVVATGATVTGKNVTLVAGKKPVRLSLTSSSTAGVGSLATLTATVVAAEVGDPTPTGSVQFRLEGVDVGTPVALNGSGVATKQVTTTSSYSIATASYSGSPTFGVADTWLELLANATATTTTLVSPPATAAAGASVTLHATVANSGSGAAPTGWVSFLADDGALLARTRVSSGSATVVTTSLFAGAHKIWAAYDGDATHQESQSSSATLTVTAAGPAPARISGVVSDGTGPLSEVTVDLYTTAGAFLRETSTGSDGSYAFGALADGSYKLRFSGAGVVTEWWQNASSLGAATAVAVATGSPAVVSPTVSAPGVPGGGISGTVTKVAGGGAVSGAWVQACATVGAACAIGKTDSNGAYQLGGLADGTYDVLVQPWGVGLAESRAAVVVSSGGTTAHDVALAALLTPPPSVTVTAAGGLTQDSIPIASWTDPTPITFTACPAGTGAFVVKDGSGATVASGPMTESLAGTYSATIPALTPRSGLFAVTTSVTGCSSGSTPPATFDIYIDPSGVVVDQLGDPIPGATVTLSQFDAGTSSYAVVANGSSVMSPANRKNPDTTDSKGHFGWDVQAGHYKVTATAPGCYKTGSPGTPSVSTGDLEVPPAVTTLSLTLFCPKDTTAPAPATAVLPVATLAGSVALHWSATDVGTGVASYDVRYRSSVYTGGFGAYVLPSAWQHTSAVSAPLTLAAGTTYCVSSRARDVAGNVSGWSAERCVTRAMDERVLVASKGWVRASSAAYYLKTLSSTTTLNASLTTRSKALVDRVGVVAVKCKTCGVVGVYVGGKLVGKVSLYSATTKRQQLVLLPKFSYRSGVVSLRSLTAKKPVQIDGIVITRI